MPSQRRWAPALPGAGCWAASSAERCSARLVSKGAAARCVGLSKPCKSDTQCCSKNCVKNGRCTKDGKLTGKCRCREATGGTTGDGGVYAFLATLKLPWCGGNREPRTLVQDWKDGHAAGGIPAVDFALDFGRSAQGESVLGTPIAAPLAGTLKRDPYGSGSGFGNHVRIDAGNGWQVILAHLQDPSPVANNTPVKQGDVVGALGTSGNSQAPHIHVEVRLNGQKPTGLFGTENVPIYGYRRDDFIFGNGQTFRSGQQCQLGATRLQIEAAVQDPVNGANIFASRPPAHTTIPAEIRLTGTDNQTFTKVGQVAYDGGKGAFVGTVDLGTDVPGGAFTVDVKFRDRVRTLRKAAGNATIRQGTTTAVPRVTLIPADANDDNAVNVLDYNMIIECYGDKYASCSEDWRRGADLNDDGQVDQFDYNLWSRVANYCVSNPC